MKKFLLLFLLMLFVIPANAWNKFTSEQKESFLVGCINTHEKRYGYKHRSYSVTKIGKDIVIEITGRYREFNI